MIRRLKVQRNWYATLAVCSLACIGFALPTKIAHYRELKAIDAHLVDLQATIVLYQQRTSVAQNEILKMQQQIRDRLAR